ncbi:MAG: septum formation protein Maf [Clostridia bacterium]|nr:septum formation protein Maf [Clostridia bacterium]
MKYILASMSPRRKEILSDMGLTFTVEPADIDENIGVKEPDMLVRELSLLKATHIAKKHTGEESLIIAADTVVALNGEILGKPSDEADAERMLKTLSGNTHSVYTGYCVSDTKTGKTVAKCAETKVTFRTLSDEEIDKYIAGGSPMDKAGAYGIQDEGGAFVSGTDGEFSNVVGLPKEALTKLLKEEFIFEGR